jgi:hypothetical protein
MTDIKKSGVFNLGSLGGDGASTTRPTRRWGGITGRSEPRGTLPIKTLRKSTC